MCNAAFVLDYLEMDICYNKDNKKLLLSADSLIQLAVKVFIFDALKALKFIREL